MPTNDFPAAGRYVTGLLATGARPFAHRGGVYRLLGRPVPQDGAVHFVPPLPPVGFVYEQGARFGGWSGERNAASLPALRPQRQAEASEGKQGKTTPEKAEGAVPLIAPPVSQRAAPERSEAPPLNPTPPPAHASSSPGQPSRQKAPAPSPEGRVGRPLQTVKPPADIDPPKETQLSSPPVEEALTETFLRREGLAVPGLTQRRAVFAALAGVLPSLNEARQEGAHFPAGEKARSEPEGLARVDATVGKGARGPETLVPNTPTPAAPSRPQRSVPEARASALSAQPGEAAVFRARTRVIEEVEHLRRAVTPPPERGVREAAEEAAREVVREAVREGALRTSPARARPQPVEPPARVVVVQPVVSAAQRVPRAFWSSSALRSTHLRMLR
jgi:hypothetical protein